jgi:uncharacterized protein (DUF1810 family)
MMQADDSSARFDLERFVVAQERFYPAVTAELRAGRKRTHWMWFIFPQVDGLGHSAMAQRYAIGSREEAAAYLAHPVLSARLLECTGLVLRHQNKTASSIFGSPDDLKFRSSMTLFNAIGTDDIFRNALEQFHQGKPDGATLDVLESWGGEPTKGSGPTKGKS